MESLTSWTGLRVAARPVPDGGGTIPAGTLVELRQVEGLTGSRSLVRFGAREALVPSGALRELPEIVRSYLAALTRIATSRRRRTITAGRKLAGAYLAAMDPEAAALALSSAGLAKLPWRG